MAGSNYRDAWCFCHILWDQTEKKLSSSENRWILLFYLTLLQCISKHDYTELRTNLNFFESIDPWPDDEGMLNLISTLLIQPILDIIAKAI